MVFAMCFNIDVKYLFWDVWQSLCMSHTVNKVQVTSHYLKDWAVVGLWRDACISVIEDLACLFHRSLILLSVIQKQMA